MPNLSLGLTAGEKTAIVNAALTLEQALDGKLRPAIELLRRLPPAKREAIFATAPRLARLVALGERLRVD